MLELHDLQIQYKKIDDLIPYQDNSRTHSPEQIQEIVDSIKRRGWTNPILLDSHNGIVAGHGRLLAAQKLGLKRVPTIDLSFASEADKVEYIIADNKLALNAGWDYGILKLQFDLLEDAGLDLKNTGFHEDELKEIRNVNTFTEGLCDEDDAPSVTNIPISKLGDVWTLGNHRLMCGDSTNLSDVEKLMSGEKADMVFTDPPYGIDEETDRVFASRTRICKGNVFDKIIGDKTTKTAIDSYNLCSSLKIPVMIFWGANYYCHNLPESANWLVWDKRCEDKQRDMNSDCELAWVKSKANSVRIFRHLWKGMIKESENGEARVHPTQKPVALAEWCFKEYDPKGKIIIDLFGGSGSTLIACEKTNRKCFMMEISPNYCDVIINRWQKFTGKKAILESTHQTFEEVTNGESRQTTLDS